MLDIEKQPFIIIIIIIIIFEKFPTIVSNI